MTALRLLGVRTLNSPVPRLGGGARSAPLPFQRSELSTRPISSEAARAACLGSWPVSTAVM